MKLYQALLWAFTATLLTATSFAQTATPNSHQFTNLQNNQSWSGYALLAPNWTICKTCTSTGSQVNWSRTAGIKSPSLSGSSARYTIGGTHPFSDILWNNHLIGDFSSQGLPDTKRTLIPTLHNFVYDVYFYAQNLPASQALEFDINQFTGGRSFIWGHECRIAGGHEWDIWNDVANRWIPTGIPCNPVNNAWNHLVIQVQRTASNQLLFKSITLNGKTAMVNHVEPSTATSWYGVTINYQQDGNKVQTGYSIWLDRLNFSAW